MRFLALVGLVVACGSEVTIDGPTSQTSSSSSSAGGAATASSATVGNGGSGNAGGATGVGCAALGGHCVIGSWAQCEPGWEPTADVHADCKPPDAVRGYFCCVPAPQSSCSDSMDMVDCFAGDFAPQRACHPCWQPANQALGCESGRTCCAYVCPD